MAKPKKPKTGVLTLSVPDSSTGKQMRIGTATRVRVTNSEGTAFEIFESRDGVGLAVRLIHSADGMSAVVIKPRVANEVELGPAE